MEKKRILIVMQWYWPGYKAGGPIQSISNLVSRLGDQYDLYILTSDTDWGEKEPYPDIRYGQWNRIGKANVMYLSRKEYSIGKVKEIISRTGIDLLYLQSFFDFRYTIIPLLICLFKSGKSFPVLVAPRGEFGEGALKQKTLKKKIYILFFRLFFKRMPGLNFHCSTEEEESAAKKNLGKDIRTYRALNFNSGSHVQENELLHVRNSPVRLVYFGRIDPKKNLDYSLAVLKSVPFGVVFDIYGSAQNLEYYDSCVKLSEDLPANVSARFMGPLPHDRILSTIKDYDIFFFPTKNENFGHTIHESLLAGVPVLTSDQTPWHKMDSMGAGWEIPLDRPDRFQQALQQYDSMDLSGRIGMHRSALSYGMEVSDNKQTLQDNAAMFNSLIFPSANA